MISLLTFCPGVVNTMKMDQLFHVYRRKGERNDFDDTSSLCSSSCPHRLCWLSLRCRYDRGLLLVLDGGVCSTPPLPVPPPHRALPACPPCPVPALPRIREAFNCKWAQLCLPQRHHPRPCLSDQGPSKSFQVQLPNFMSPFQEVYFWSIKAEIPIIWTLSFRLYLYSIIFLVTFKSCI